MDFTAVIAARAGSRRVKNKNIRPFGKTNLIVHKIEQLKQVKEISRIVVSSDSEEILEYGKANSVIIHKRAREYCDEKTKSMGEVIAHICENIEGEEIIWTPCTAPLITPDLYGEAIRRYKEEILEGYDSLFTAEEIRAFICDKNGRPLNYEFGVNQVPSQKLEPIYFSTGGIYIAPRLKMIEWKYYIGNRPYMFILDKKAAMDIDDELDLLCAQAWLDA